MMDKAKKKIAIFTASGCRGCEKAFLDIHYQVHPITRWAEIMFWPWLLGSQLADLDDETAFDTCFFSGSIRTRADRDTALKLRKKSKTMVAIGACAAFGGLPGLANLRNRSLTTSSTALPQTGEGPEEDDAPSAPARLEDRVRALSQAVEVDYTVPGCPPSAGLLWAAVQALVCEGRAPARISYAASRLPESIAQPMLDGFAPPGGSVFAGEKAVCASCSRNKEEKKFEILKRPFQEFEESGRCLLEQGLVCQGIATREGCGGLCTGMGQPCRGCYGKAEAIFDPGAKMVSAISSTFDTGDENEIMDMADNFEDLTGMFYRYTLPTQCALLCGNNKLQITKNK